MRKNKKILAIALTALLCITGSLSVWADEGLYTIDPNDPNIVHPKLNIFLDDDLSGKTIVVENGSMLGFKSGGMAAEIYGCGSDVEIVLDGGIVSGDVVGGRSETGTVKNNTIKIISGSIGGSLVGGISGLELSNNTLHIANKSIEAKNVYNFQALKFTIPSDIAPVDTLLNITGESGLSGMNIDATKIEWTPGARLQKGDYITLVRNFGNTVGTITGKAKSSDGRIEGEVSLVGSDLRLTVTEYKEKEQEKEKEDINNGDNPIYIIKPVANEAPVKYTPGGNLTTTIIRAVGTGDPYDHFLSVKLNGKVLTAGKHYTAKRGSLILNILPEALGGLPKGTNQLTVTFDDGDITIPFDLAELSKKSPSTGEV